jgi:hypothetical protein
MKKAVQARTWRIYSALLGCESLARSWKTLAQEGRTHKTFFSGIARHSLMSARSNIKRRAAGSHFPSTSFSRSSSVRASAEGSHQSGPKARPTLTLKQCLDSGLTLNSCQEISALRSGLMATKAQHTTSYRRLPAFLRTLREEAGLTQRELGARLNKPQSWVYNCEAANRRVDVTEFIAWTKACAADPRAAFARFLERV